MGKGGVGSVAEVTGCGVGQDSGLAGIVDIGRGVERQRGLQRQGIGLHLSGDLPSSCCLTKP
ncbi:hypothetical protein GA0074692_3214 [Micromonospora pallida]|uniref:Uncharacterized protein n=1 Tax=Micromonospora pallida TaxID=145854 RepID=A0A1C6SQV1_9ACTN|nr:hypothetical protein GA0074692_3214 [Micromonospora pallida]